MRLLAFTDIHENERFLERIRKAAVSERPDVIVCTGDFTVFGRSTRSVLKTIDSFGKPVILIHGNHEDEQEVASTVAKMKNITFVHLGMADTQGYRFMGFGGGGFRTQEPELERFEKKMAKQFTDKTIFLSHAPPYGTKLDMVDEDWHVGNESLRGLITRRKPLLVLCGHIHECFHAHDSIGETTIINPGPDGEIIDLDDE